MGGICLCRTASLGAEKQQVVQQGFRNLVLPLGKRCELHQDARCSPFDIHIVRQQLLCNGLKVSGGHAPKSFPACVGRTGGQAYAEGCQLLSPGWTVGFDHQQDKPIEQRSHGCVAVQRRSTDGCHQLDAVLIKRPQIGRMYALCCGQFLNLTVLNEQRHRMHRLVVEYRFQVFNEREARALHPVGCFFVAHQRSPHKALYGRFHGAQHLGRRDQAHHFQSTHRLVQLLTRHTQRTGIHRFQIVVARFFGLANKTLDGFVGGVQRFSQLVKHPSQRTEVSDRSVRLRTVGT